MSQHKDTFYITTPLYYVNAKPHIGHAYTNILCDAFARYHRFMDEKVFFMTGTDEHGTKIEKTALENGMQPQEYVDKIVPFFKELWQGLGIQHDYFFRTTDAGHKEVVRRILKDLEAKGEIYKTSYVGWYSIKSETFYTEAELVDGKCPDTGGEVQKIEEENYFFKMSKYQDWLIDYIHQNPGFIQPEMRKNEILGFLRQPLEDLCITRPKARLRWGIEYPDTEDYVIYVWFDALINYISGAGYKLDENRFHSLWPADVHVVGKDILRHHAVYWPIMLKACGIEMPRTILAHGWWTISGAKVSKSSGNTIDPAELIQKYGVDAVRYFLLNEVTVGMDGAYSEDLLRERYRTDLANDLGNLWFRFASMLAKYFEGKIPASSENYRNEELMQQAFFLWPNVTGFMKDYDPRRALASVWAVITRCNQYVEEQKPWVLAKDPSKRDELVKTMVVLGECLAHIACILQAFLPETSARIMERLHLGTEMKVSKFEDFHKAFLTSGIAVERGEALFPKLEDEPV